MMKNSVKVAKSLATLGFFGYLPAPGTQASLIISIMIWVGSFVGIMSLVEIFLITIGSFFIVQQALHGFLGKDPKEIVLDEVVGSLWVFLLVPVTTQNIIFGFLLFRLFDITKIAGISYLESLPGAWGVLGDDIAAGVLTSVCLFFLKSSFASALCVL